MKKVHLTLEQRYTISAMYQNKFSQKVIAEAIGKHKSVVSREIKRNSNARGQYTFKYAQESANLRKERMKNPRKLYPWLKKDIEEMIKDGWSPKQIEGRLKLENKDYVSHETIYKTIRKDKADGGNLYQYTRHKLKHRKRSVTKQIPIKNRIPISQRPTIVDTKERFGDWEFDTIIGENNKGAILTMAERKTAFMMMEKLEYGKNAKELTKVATRLLTGYMSHVHTITSDNGPEFADHQAIARKLKTQFYFTEPYSAWQKGLIENTNKLVRQYIPKSTNFENLTQQQIKEIQYKLNSRPRQNLNFYSPKEIFSLSLQNKVAFRC